MIYITIDTNIYLNILLDPNEYTCTLKDKNYGELLDNKIEGVTDKYIFNSRENRLPKSLIPLKILSDNNVIKLIITEVTKLELVKQNARCIDDINAGYKQLETAIKNEKMWNNISYIQNELQSVLKQNKKMNIENWTYGYKALTKFLESEKHINLELTPNIICNLYKKNIAGLLGNTNKEVENVTKNNDYLFVNTLQEYFKNNNDKDNQIFLITNDKKDFRGQKTTDNSERIFHELKDNFKDKNTNIKILSHMNSLYKLIDAQVDLKKFIDKKIEPIFKERNKNTLFDKNIIWYDEHIKKDIIDEFNNKNKSLNEIKIIREKVLNEIINLLNESRQIPSWDDRSEFKLLPFLEFHEEGELIILNLSTLLTIKENLLECKEIHLDMIPTFK